MAGTFESATVGKSVAKVLIVDGNEHLRQFLREILEDDGFSVGEAGTTDEAHRELVQNGFDLMITDTAVAEMKVMETLRAVRRQRPHFRVLAMVGGNPHWLVDARLLGADATIKKPFHPDEILIVARAMLGTAPPLWRSES